MRTMIPTRDARRTLVGATALLLTCVIGLAVAATLTGKVPLPGVLALPPPLMAAGIVLLALTPVLIRRWRATFWIFLSWLVVEDLVRKFLGNNLVLYFAKDLIYVLLLAGFAMDPHTRHSWRRAAGPARLALYAMMAWALVMAIPSAMLDWRLPLLGLRLDFLYVPLVAVGFTLARDREELRQLLTGATIIGVAGCVVGIAQGIIGPSFLSPSVETPGLRLVLIRAHDVFQPTGTFADAGRFGTLTQLTLVAALALFLLTERPERLRRILAAASIMIAAAAVWVHAGKTNLLVSASILILAFLAPTFAQGRPVLARGLVAAAAMVAAILVFSWLFPALTQGRLQYFQETLDPAAPTNEWSARRAYWAGGPLAGWRLGGVFGQGTGVTALGRQYLYSSDPTDARAQSHLESGYGAVLQEWGVLGLVLWAVWTLAWVRREWESVVNVRGTTLAAAGLVLLGWMIVFLFVGLVGGFSGFQNYSANSYFWLLSGVLFALPDIPQRRAGEPRFDAAVTSVP